MTRTMGTLREDQYTLLVITRSFRMNNLSEKSFREK